jgi:hypothetical protein
MARSPFEQLAASARADHPAPLDVRTGVLAALARRRAAPRDRTLVLCAAASLAAAALVTLAVLPELSALQDPLAGMFSALDGVPR